MATRQEKEERAEVKAWKAAQDLRDANRQREYEERATKMETTDHPQLQEEKPGVLGSVFKRVADTYEHAKEVVVGRSQDTAEKTKETAFTAEEKARENKDYATDKAKETTDAAARKVDETKASAKEKAEGLKDSTKGNLGEYADKANETKEATEGKLGEYKHRAAEEAKETAESAKEKADEYKNAAAEKAKETKDRTVEKAVDARDYTAEKAKETKDYTADKAVEGKDTAAGKLGELSESAKGAARKAMGLFSGKKEEAMDRSEAATVATKEKMSEAEEQTRRKMEELKMEGEGYKEDKNNEAERGSRARDNIYGTTGLGTIKESIKAKFMQPHDIVEDARAAREHGGTAGRKGSDDKPEGGEKVVKEGVVVMEDTTPGAVAANLKRADDMSGQTFNDVGPINEEGVIRSNTTK